MTAAFSGSPASPALSVRGSEEKQCKRGAWEPPAPLDAAARTRRSLWPRRRRSSSVTGLALALALVHGKKKQVPLGGAEEKEVPTYHSPVSVACGDPHAGVPNMSPAQPVERAAQGMWVRFGASNSGAVANQVSGEGAEKAGPGAGWRAFLAGTGILRGKKRQESSQVLFFCS